MGVSLRLKIIVLWSVFLLGTLFHTQLALMPLFHGLSVAESQPAQSLNEISTILWLMLGFFGVPMLAMIATVFTAARSYRVGHFGLTVIYTILNFLHVVFDLWVQPILWYQIALMVFLLGIGLLLNGVSFQWLQAEGKAALAR